MPGTTMSYYDAMLKEKYAPAVIDSLENDVWWWKTFAHEGGRWVGDSATGRMVVEPILVGRNVGTGARPDAGTMPTAGYQTTTKHLIYQKYNYGAIQVTGPTMAASAKGTGAFEKAMEFEMTHLVTDLKKDLNREFGATDLGILGYVTTGATSATQTIDYAGASSGAVSGRFGTMYTPANVGLAIGTAAELGGTGTPAYSTVSSVTNRTTVVLADSVTTVTADLVSKAGSTASAAISYNNEIEGLQRLRAVKVAGTGSYQNISYSSYPAWFPYRSSASGVNRTLTWNLMQQCVDEIALAGGNCNLIVAHITMRPEFLDMLLNDKRYLSVANLDPGANLNQLKFDTIPMKFIVDSPYNQMAFLETDTWTYYPEGQPNWQDEDGSVLSRSGDTMTALFRIYSNFGCSIGSHNAFLDDITVTLSAT